MVIMADKPKKVQVDGFVPIELAEEFENLAFDKYGPKHGYRGKALADALNDWIKKMKSEK